MEKVAVPSVFSSDTHATGLAVTSSYYFELHVSDLPLDFILI